MSPIACESTASWTRAVTAAMSPAMREACAVSWPMSGSVAPGHEVPAPVRASARAFCTSGSAGARAESITAICHSPKREADTAMATARSGSSSGAVIRRSVSTQSSAARRIASTRPTFTPRSTTGSPTFTPPTVRKRAVCSDFGPRGPRSPSQRAAAITTATAPSTAMPTEKSLFRLIRGSPR